MKKEIENKNKKKEKLLKRRAVNLCKRSRWITSGYLRHTQVAPTVIDGLQCSVEHLTCVRCRDTKANSTADQIGCRESDTDDGYASLKHQTVEVPDLMEIWK